jgi:hypothetical protein
MAESSHGHPSALLDCVIVAAGGGFIFLISRAGVEAGHPALNGGAAILGCLYIIYLGVLFLLSYMFPDKTFVLNFLRYVCDECSMPRSASGRRMALFFFALGLGIGGWVLLVGLGVMK